MIIPTRRVRCPRCGASVGFVDRCPACGQPLPTLGFRIDLRERRGVAVVVGAIVAVILVVILEVFLLGR